MWDVEYTDTFGSWWHELTADEQERVTAAVELLEHSGPALGRPLVDTLKGSRHPNVKELRPHGGHMRVLFAFDSRRIGDPAHGRRQEPPLEQLVRRRDPSRQHPLRRTPPSTLRRRSNPMTAAKTTKTRKDFDELRKQIDADPARRANVEQHKTAMLGELRRKLDLTQANLADRLDVTQENISQIERGETDIRLSTLNRYIEALGGRLEVRAAFPGQTISLSVGKSGTMRRKQNQAAHPAA